MNALSTYTSAKDCIMFISLFIHSSNLEQKSIVNKTIWPAASRILSKNCSFPLNRTVFSVPAKMRIFLLLIYRLNFKI